MPTIDNTKNIQRIVDTLLKDINVFDSGVTKGKARAVLFGDPNNNEKLPQSMKPYIYVTTRDFLQTTSRDFGVSNVNSIYTNTVEYEIVLVADSRSKTVEAQKQLYDILKNVRISLEADPLFKDPTTGLDPVFARSVVSDIPYDTKTRGKQTTSLSIILTATIGNLFTINFPTIGIIAFLSKPASPEGIIFDEDNEQSGRRTITEKGDFGNIFGEYESTPSLDASFRAKFGVEEDVTMTIGTTPRVIKVVYIEINPTVSFDSIERSILHLEIVA